MEILITLVAQEAVPSETVWALAGGCGLIAVLAFFAIFRLTRSSRKAVEQDVNQRLTEMKRLIAATRPRIQRLDSEIIDHMRMLSSRGTQSFNVLKQMLASMESRVSTVEKLLLTGNLPDLFRAQEILQQAIKSESDHYSSVIFSEAVLTLKPDQLASGLDAMVSAVERDLAEPRDENEEVDDRPRFVPRKRQFTIRGFIRAITGATDD